MLERARLGTPDLSYTITSARSLAPRSDDRTTNLSRLIIIGNLRTDLFSVATVRDKNVWWENRPVNPKCGNRHDNKLHQE